MCFTFLVNNLGYEMNQRNKTHMFVYSLKYIICKGNEKCDTYTSPLTKHMKINWNRVTQHLLHHWSNNIEVDGSKENNDILVSSYIEIWIYTITKKNLNYIYQLLKYLSTSPRQVDLDHDTLLT